MSSGRRAARGPVQAVRSAAPARRRKWVWGIGYGVYRSLRVKRSARYTLYPIPYTLRFKDLHREREGSFLAWIHRAYARYVPGDFLPALIPNAHKQRVLPRL